MYRLTTVIRIFPGCLLAFFLANTVAAQMVCPKLVDVETGVEKPNASQLCTVLRFEKGKITFDAEKTLFTPSDKFKSKLKIPVDKTEKLLLGYLKNGLAKLKYPYTFALNDQSEGDIKELKSHSGSWEEYKAKHDNWAMDGRMTSTELFDRFDVFGTSKLFDSLGVKGTFEGSFRVEAVSLTDGGCDDCYDERTGYIRFRVDDPISDYADENQAKLALTGRTGSVSQAEKDDIEKLRQKILDKLKKFDGIPFCKSCSENKIKEFFQSMGLFVEIETTLSSDSAVESPIEIEVGIWEILEVRLKNPLSNEQVDQTDRNKILYIMLDEKSFRSYLKKYRDENKLPEVVNYQDLSSPNPYFNASKFQIQQLLLNEIGYVVTFLPSSGSSKILLIKKFETDPDKKEKTLEKSVPQANEEGSINTSEQDKQRLTDFQPKIKTPKKEREKTLFLGGGFDYLPDQGARFFGLIQKSRLRLPIRDSGVSSFSLKFGGQQGIPSALGSLNFSSDYVLFDVFKRRISFQLSVSEDIEGERILENTETDEVRRNGLVRLEFEPFRDYNGQILRFYGEGRLSTVNLVPEANPVNGITKQNYNSLELGAFYFAETFGVEHPRWLKIEPKLIFGLGLSSNEPKYRILQLDGRFHQSLPRRFVLDLTGRLGAATENTPIFDQFSIGGSNTIRGFRRDAAIGRKTWNLQNELWIPLPISGTNNGKFTELLRNNIRIAPFVDVGGVWKTTQSSAGFRTGAGLGLRIIYNPVVFKLDYGYGFGDAVAGKNRGKFYFSVETNLPF